jgi:hypothetical protein
MSRAISNDQAANLGLRGRASYDDGERVKKIPKEKMPDDPLMLSVAALAKSVKDISDTSNKTVESMVTSLQQSNAMISASIEKALSERKTTGPEEWKFEIQRDRDRLLTTVTAKRVK